MPFSLVMIGDRHPMVELLDEEMRQAWIAGRIGWATLCPEDGWPNSCHRDGVFSWQGANVRPEEREHGIPTGTFAAIRRLWKDDRPMPRRWA